MSENDKPIELRVPANDAEHHEDDPTWPTDMRVRDLVWFLENEATTWHLDVMEAARDALMHCDIRVAGDGTMHVAKKLLEDAIVEYDNMKRGV
jgi:hypothetical protein